MPKEVMLFEVSVDLDRIEGVNVSKDLLADEIMEQLNGVEFETDLTILEDSRDAEVEGRGILFQILHLEYKGSKQGQPLKFEVVAAHLDFDDGNYELDPEAVANALGDIVLNDIGTLTITNHMDSESEYEVLSVDVKVK